VANIRCHQSLFKNIDAILFDKDGTLADSAPFLAHLGRKRAHLLDSAVPGVYNTILRTFGLGVEGMDAAGLLAVGTRYENEVAIAAHLVTRGIGWMDALAIAQAAFRDADAATPSKAPHTPLFPGVRALLDTLRGRGVGLGLLSADSSKNVDEFVQTYHLTPYFKCVMGMDDPPGKPDPRWIRRACAKLGIEGDRLLVIGDSPLDIQLAHNGQTAGCIAVTWGGADPQQLQGAGAIAHHIHDIQVM
jgi:phosphoglycolate phosphatase